MTKGISAGSADANQNKGTYFTGWGLTHMPGPLEPRLGDSAAIFPLKSTQMQESVARKWQKIQIISFLSSAKILQTKMADILM